MSALWPLAGVRNAVRTPPLTYPNRLKVRSGFRCRSTPVTGAVPWPVIRRVMVWV